MIGIVVEVRKNAKSPVRVVCDGDDLGWCQVSHSAWSTVSNLQLVGSRCSVELLEAPDYGVTQFWVPLSDNSSPLARAGSGVSIQGSVEITPETLIKIATLASNPATLALGAVAQVGIPLKVSVVGAIAGQPPLEPASSSTEQVDEVIFSPSAPQLLSELSEFFGIEEVDDSIDSDGEIDRMAYEIEAAFDIAYSAVLPKCAPVTSIVSSFGRLSSAVSKLSSSGDSEAGAIGATLSAISASIKAAEVASSIKLPSEINYEALAYYSIKLALDEAHSKFSSWMKGYRRRL